MEYVRLGSTGMKVSRICLGCIGVWRCRKRWIHIMGCSTKKIAAPLAEKALELGINFFDTANVYSLDASKRFSNRANKDFLPNEMEVVIATNCWKVREELQMAADFPVKLSSNEINASLNRLGKTM